VHEVIVDAPDHGREVSATAWAMWRRRYETAVRAHPHAVPVLFKNRGAYAGATLVHPHTQMIVLDRIPERWERMRATEGGCRWCADLTAARSAGTIVAENAEAVAYVRTSSRFSWSLTVLPRACEPSVDRAGRAPWTGVGVLVAAAAEGLLERWSREAAFNVVLPSDPSAAPGRFHWHAEVIPRLATLAGFELATGLFIRSAPAEESAERWRQLIALPHGSV
jgi:UDPglucose--hexose-1-phosphate uridylyltransferase